MFADDRVILLDVIGDGRGAMGRPVLTLDHVRVGMLSDEGRPADLTTVRAVGCSALCKGRGGQNSELLHHKPIEFKSDLF